MRKIISVCGTASNSGKTTAACILIHHLKPCAAVKTVTADGHGESPCPKNKPCGVCSGLKDKWIIHDEPEIINEPETDTCRLKNAGAHPVLWIISRSDSILEAFETSLQSFSEQTVIVEGNGIARYGLSDLIILVLSQDGSVKKSALPLMKTADFYVSIDPLKKEVLCDYRKQYGIRKKIYSLNDRKESSALIRKIKEFTDESKRKKD